MKFCAACHQDLPKDKFSKKQWKLGAKSQRRCTSCVRENREVVQPPPPKNKDVPDDNGIVTSLDSMSMNDNEMILPSDEDLFKMPRPNEDCPICFLEMPSIGTGSKYMNCCGKMICGGCVYANAMIDLNKQLCPFCRTPTQKSVKELRNRLQNRVKMNDEKAMFNLGCGYDRGTYGCPRNYDKALEFWHRAGDLGYKKAYNNIGNSYYNGRRVNRDEKKAIHYWGLAAMGGDTKARYCLAFMEHRAGNFDRELKHLIIAARGGHSASLDEIKELFTKGHATKDEYESALRAHQSYLDEIRSNQRDEAAAHSEEYKYY